MDNQLKRTLDTQVNTVSEGELSELPHTKIARSISSGADPQIMNYASAIKEEAVPNDLGPEPIEFIPCGTSGSPGSSQTQNMEDENEIDDPVINLINYGSDNDDIDSDDDENSLFFLPRTQRLMFANDVETNDPKSASHFTPSDVAQSFTPMPSWTQLPMEAKPMEPAGLFDFKWTALPQPPIPPQERRECFSHSTGPTDTFLDPSSAFLAIWDQEIMEYIVKETNRYAQQLKQKLNEGGKLKRESSIMYWKDTNVNEMYVFFALILATGIVVKANMTEYWARESDVFETPGFGAYMKYNRFTLLSRCLHFNNNEVDMTALLPAQAKLFKIAPIVNHLNCKFQALYNLGQNIAIDDSLTHWRGWLNIKQFINKKVASAGVKTYEVCDAMSGYLWRFDVLAGKRDHTSGLNESPVLGYIPSLVLKLLEKLEYRGHTVWMDHTYNSPALSRTLKSRGFDCVGTLRLNKKFVPSSLDNVTNQYMSVCELRGMTSGDIDILAWRDDNCDISMTSTYHGLTYVTRKEKCKPTVLFDYNTRVGTLDKKDKMLAMLPIEREQTRVWYKKFFRRLLNVSVLNAFILHKNSPHKAGPSTNHITLLKTFRKVLIKSLLSTNSSASILTPITSGMCSEAPIFSNELLRHLPAEFDFKPDKTQRVRKACVVCHKRIHTYCPGCRVPVCAFSCFGKHHS